MGCGFEEQCGRTSACWQTGCGSRASTVRSTCRRTLSHGVLQICYPCRQDMWVKTAEGVPLGHIEETCWSQIPTFVVSKPGRWRLGLARTRHVTSVVRWCGRWCVHTTIAPECPGILPWAGFRRLNVAPQPTPHAVKQPRTLTVQCLLVQVVASPVGPPQSMRCVRDAATCAPGTCRRHEGVHDTVHRRQLLDPLLLLQMRMLPLRQTPLSHHRRRRQHGQSVVRTSCTRTLVRLRTAMSVRI